MIKCSIMSKNSYVLSDGGYAKPGDLVLLEYTNCQDIPVRLIPMTSGKGLSVLSLLHSIAEVFESGSGSISSHSMISSHDLGALNFSKRITNI